MSRFGKHSEEDFRTVSDVIKKMATIALVLVLVSARSGCKYSP
jgi:hypothetical protein